MLIKISLEIEQVCQISAAQKSVSSRHSRRIVPISGSMNGCDRAGTYEVFSMDSQMSE